MMPTDHFSQLVMDLPQLGQFLRAELYEVVYISIDFDHDANSG
jgi:hypothetical protein